MLRITAAETATEQGWTLEGRLVGPCVGEVRTRWKQRHRLRTDAQVRSILVRSRSSTKKGKDSSEVMSKETTQFIATSISIKRVLDQWKLSGKRCRLKVIYCFFGALLGGVIVPPGHLQATQKRPKTNAVRGSTGALHSANQREGIYSSQFFQKLRKEQNRAS